MVWWRKCRNGIPWFRGAFRGTTGTDEGTDRSIYDDADDDGGKKDNGLTRFVTRLLLLNRLGFSRGIPGVDEKNDGI